MGVGGANPPSGKNCFPIVRGQNKDEVCLEPFKDDGHLDQGLNALCGEGEMTWPEPSGQPVCKSIRDQTYLETVAQNLGLKERSSKNKTGSSELDQVTDADAPVVAVWEIGPEEAPYRIVDIRSDAAALNTTPANAFKSADIREITIPGSDEKITVARLPSGALYSVNALNGDAGAPIAMGTEPLGYDNDIAASLAQEQEGAIAKMTRAEIEKQIDGLKASLPYFKANQKELETKAVKFEKQADSLDAQGVAFFKKNATPDDNGNLDISDPKKRAKLGKLHDKEMELRQAARDLRHRLPLADTIADLNHRADALEEEAQKSNDRDEATKLHERSNTLREEAIKLEAKVYTTEKEIARLEKLKNYAPILARAMGGDLVLDPEGNIIDSYPMWYRKHPDQIKAEVAQLRSEGKEEAAKKLESYLPRFKGFVRVDALMGQGEAKLPEKIPSIPTQKDLEHELAGLKADLPKYEKLSNNPEPPKKIRGQIGKIERALQIGRAARAAFQTTTSKPVAPPQEMKPRQGKFTGAVIQAHVTPEYAVNPVTKDHGLHWKDFDMPIQLGEELGPVDGWMSPAPENDKQIAWNAQAYAQIQPRPCVVITDDTDNGRVFRVYAVMGDLPKSLTPKRDGSQDVLTRAVTTNGVVFVYHSEAQLHQIGYDGKKSFFGIDDVGPVLDRVGDDLRGAGRQLGSIPVGVYHGAKSMWNWTRERFLTTTPGDYIAHKFFGAPLEGAAARPLEADQKILEGEKKPRPIVPEIPKDFSLSDLDIPPPPPSDRVEVGFGSGAAALDNAPHLIAITTGRTAQRLEGVVDDQLAQFRAAHRAPIQGDPIYIVKDGLIDQPGGQWTLEPLAETAYGQIDPDMARAYVDDAIARAQRLNDPAPIIALAKYPDLLIAAGRGLDKNPEEADRQRVRARQIAEILEKTQPSDGDRVWLGALRMIFGDALDPNITPEDHDAAGQVLFTELAVRNYKNVDVESVRHRSPYKFAWPDGTGFSDRLFRSMLPSFRGEEGDPEMAAIQQFTQATGTADSMEIGWEFAELTDPKERLERQLPDDLNPLLKIDFDAYQQFVKQAQGEQGQVGQDALLARQKSDPDAPIRALKAKKEFFNTLLHVIQSDMPKEKKLYYFVRVSRELVEMERLARKAKRVGDQATAMILATSIDDAQYIRQQLLPIINGNLPAEQKLPAALLGQLDETGLADLGAALRDRQDYLQTLPEIHATGNSEVNTGVAASLDVIDPATGQSTGQLAKLNESFEGLIDDLQWWTEYYEKMGQNFQTDPNFESFARALESFANKKDLNQFFFPYRGLEKQLVAAYTSVKGPLLERLKQENFPFDVDSEDKFISVAGQSVYGTALLKALDETLAAEGEKDPAIKTARETLQKNLGKAKDGPFGPLDLAEPKKLQQAIAVYRLGRAAFEQLVSAAGDSREDALNTLYEKGVEPDDDYEFNSFTHILPTLTPAVQELLGLGLFIIFNSITSHFLPKGLPQDILGNHPLHWTFVYGQTMSMGDKIQYYNQIQRSYRGKEALDSIHHEAFKTMKMKGEEAWATGEGLFVHLLYFSVLYNYGIRFGTWAADSGRREFQESIAPKLNAADRWMRDVTGDERPGTRFDVRVGGPRFTDDVQGSYQFDAMQAMQGVVGTGAKTIGTAVNGVKRVAKGVKDGGISGAGQAVREMATDSAAALHEFRQAVQQDPLQVVRDSLQVIGVSYKPRGGQPGQPGPYAKVGGIDDAQTAKQADEALTQREAELRTALENRPTTEHDVKELASRYERIAREINGIDLVKQFGELPAEARKPFAENILRAMGTEPPADVDPEQVVREIQNWLNSRHGICGKQGLLRGYSVIGDDLISKITRPAADGAQYLLTGGGRVRLRRRKWLGADIQGAVNALQAVENILVVAGNTAGPESPLYTKAAGTVAEIHRAQVIGVQVLHPLNQAKADKIEKNLARGTEARSQLAESRQALEAIETQLKTDTPDRHTLEARRDQLLRQCRESAVKARNYLGHASAQLMKAGGKVVAREPMGDFRKGQTGTAGTPAVPTTTTLPPIPAAGRAAVDAAYRAASEAAPPAGTDVRLPTATVMNALRGVGGGESSGGGIIVAGVDPVLESRLPELMSSEPASEPQLQTWSSANQNNTKGPSFSEAQLASEVLASLPETPVAINQRPAEPTVAELESHPAAVEMTAAEGLAAIGNTNVTRGVEPEVKPQAATEPSRSSIVAGKVGKHATGGAMFVVSDLLVELAEAKITGDTTRIDQIFADPAKYGLDQAKAMGAMAVASESFDAVTKANPALLAGLPEGAIALLKNNCAMFAMLTAAQLIKLGEEGKIDPMNVVGTLGTTSAAMLSADLIVNVMVAAGWFAKNSTVAGVVTTVLMITATKLIEKFAPVIPAAIDGAKREMAIAGIRNRFVKASADLESAIQHPDATPDAIIAARQEFTEAAQAVMALNDPTLGAVQTAYNQRLAALQKNYEGKVAEINRTFERLKSPPDGIDFVGVGSQGRRGTWTPMPNDQWVTMKGQALAKAKADHEQAVLEFYNGPAYEQILAEQRSQTPSRVRKFQLAREEAFFKANREMTQEIFAASVAERPALQAKWQAKLESLQLSWRNRFASMMQDLKHDRALAGREGEASNPILAAELCDNALGVGCVTYENASWDPKSGTLTPADPSQPIRNVVTSPFNSLLRSKGFGPGRGPWSQPNTIALQTNNRSAAFLRSDNVDDIFAFTAAQSDRAARAILKKSK